MEGAERESVDSKLKNKISCRAEYKNETLGTDDLVVITSCPEYRD